MGNTAWRYRIKERIFKEGRYLKQKECTGTAGKNFMEKEKQEKNLEGKAVLGRRGVGREEDLGNSMVF